MAQPSGPYRDVYGLLKWIRNVLIGRKPYLLHNRFEQFVAPRTLPRPDIPRGPEYKYSDQRYHKRAFLHSVAPPVVAPVGLGRCKRVDGGRCKPMTVEKCEIIEGHMEFGFLPTPGCVFWWDGHCYYECVEDYCPPTPSKKKDIPPDVPTHVRVEKRLAALCKPEAPCENEPPCDPCEVPSDTKEKK